MPLKAFQRASILCLQSPKSSDLLIHLSRVLPACFQGVQVRRINIDMTSMVLLVPLLGSSFPCCTFGAARLFTISALGLLRKCGLNSRLLILRTRLRGRRRWRSRRYLNLSGSCTIDVSKGLKRTAFMRACLIPHHQTGFGWHKAFLGYNSIAPL